jgi:hypothetical protein
MLQMRILCKILPQHFDQFDDFVGSSTNYLSIVSNDQNNTGNNIQRTIEIKNKCYKIIQEAKRTLLNTYFSAYQYKILKYDQEYENTFKLLENMITINDSSVMIHKIKEYMTSFTNRLQQEIFDQILTSRGILLHNRQRSSSVKNAIGVSPETYLDLLDNPFNTVEWNQLSLGSKSYVCI